MESLAAATVISIFPKPLYESKPGIIPDSYAIPPGSMESPGVLAITDVRVPRPQALGQAPIITIEPGIQVAKSLVEDYCQSKVCSAPDAHPGLIYVMGVYDSTAAKLRFGVELKVAEQKQNRWYKNLVVRADDDWSKFRLHRMITDEQRMAANELHLVREWTSLDTNDFQTCPGCSTRVLNTAAVCPSCSAILDEERYKKLKFAS